MTDVRDRERDEIEQVIAKWRVCPQPFSFEGDTFTDGTMDGRLECADELEAVLRRSRAVPPIDDARLRDVLCWVSQIFNGWRGYEEWSKWDEEVAQAVVELQMAVTKDKV